MRTFATLRARWAVAAVAVATMAGLTATFAPADASTTAPQQAAAPAAAAALPAGFKSVGYMPSWSGSVNAVQYSKLTHINYAFVLPNSNGSLQGVPDGGKLSSLVSAAHANGVKVSLVHRWLERRQRLRVRGARGQLRFPHHLRQRVMGVINQYGLDGVDIDWEYPDPGTSGNNYTALMQQLSNTLHANGKLLTAAVVSEGGTANGVQPAVFGYVDWLNIMAYDGGSPHANYDWSIAAANFWKNRGLPEGQDRARRAVLQPPRLPDLRADRRDEPEQRQRRLRPGQRRPAVLQRHPDDQAARPSGRSRTAAAS